jgi:hypothetical protein
MGLKLGKLDCPWTFSPIIKHRKFGISFNKYIFTQAFKFKKKKKKKKGLFKKCNPS